MTTLQDWLLGAAPPAVLVMDGGVSTHLEHLVGGTKPFSHRSLWSSSLLLTPEGRSTIQQGHENWLEAGSDILTTVTYQCHYGALDRDPVLEESQMTELFQQGVRLAKAAVEGRARSNKSDYSSRKYVVASSGCYGAALADGAEYTGNYPGMTHERLVEFHQRKSHAFLEQQPDGLAIETVPSHAEVRAVCQVLKDISVSSIKTSTTTPACWISLACRNSSELNEGTPLQDALQTIRELDPQAQHVHAIGINCCDIAHVSSLLKILVQDMATSGPRRGIVLYPNSGEEWDADNEKWTIGTGCTVTDEFANRLLEAYHGIETTWNEFGSGSPMPRVILGGCCRTSPGTIAALRQLVDEKILVVK
jgi:homocysteine S-methyltransferase